MKCPNCALDLEREDRHEVEFDQCPACRGMWLDRRAMDRIIERATEPCVLPEPARRPEPVSPSQAAARKADVPKREPREVLADPLPPACSGASIKQDRDRAEFDAWRRHQRQEDTRYLHWRG